MAANKPAGSIWQRFVAQARLVSPAQVVATAPPCRSTLQGGASGGGLTGSVGHHGPQGPPPATQGNPTHANVRKPSDQRFRSFAERYCVARAHLLTADPMKLAEEQYNMVLDAKRFYAMIERTGQNIQPEDGVF